MSVLKLMDELEEIIESSPNVPLSGKILIAREDILEILKEIRIVLPDEIKQAQWIKQERNSILDEAQKEAENMTMKAKDHVRSLIENDDIVKQSTKISEDIIKKAEETALEIKHSSLIYADDILAGLQGNISEILGKLTENRKELRNMKE